MIRSSMLRALALGAGLSAPGAAWAGKVVLPPLLADATVDDGQKTGMHQLLASELDFHPEVTDVIPVGSAVAPNLDCLDSAACLKGVALANGGDQLLAGTVTGAVDGGLSLEIVFFDGTTIAARKSFALPRDSTSLANAMTPIVKEILGGGTAAIGGAPSASDFDLDDDVPVAVAAAPPAPAAPAPAPVQAPPPPPPPAPAPRAPVAAADPVPSAPALSPGARRLAAASVATGLGIGKLPPPTTSREPLAYTRRNPLDLDATPSSTRSRSAASSGEIDHLVQITVRGGASTFRSLAFVTAGAEVGVVVYQGLHLQAGMDVFAGRAPLPFEVQVETGTYGRWAWFYPYNVGAKYALPMGRLQPYAGADVVAAQYALGAWALGGRVRGGADFMFSDNVGLNANLSFGYWSGNQWDVTWGVPGGGILPQLSVGTVFAF